jgi:uncharacterized protein (TIGR02466 family)
MLHDEPVLLVDVVLDLSDELDAVYGAVGHRAVHAFGAGRPQHRDERLHHEQRRDRDQSYDEYGPPRFFSRPRAASHDSSSSIGRARAVPIAVMRGGYDAPVSQPKLALAAFPTPIVVVELAGMDAINREIATQLLAEEQTVPSVRRANVGGWHSVPDLSQREAPCYRTLFRAIVDEVARLVGALASDIGETRVPPFRYGVTGWAMVLREGHYVTTHDHGDAHWSIAYYVDAGDDAPRPSGVLAFIDPRRSGRQVPELQLFPSTLDIAPRTGALVIFPGWIQHYVHAYRGQRPRICVSANLTMDLAPMR